MKTKQILNAFALLALSGSLIIAAPLGTAFTYQGRLTVGTNAANGNYDFRFAVYDAAVGSSNAVSGPITNSPVGVTNGLFTTTLDFGAGAFQGEARWLDLAVRTNGAPVDFTTLAPRQALTPAPYALFAPRAGTATNATAVAPGAVVNASLQTSAVTSDKVADNSLQPADLNLSAFNTTFWQVAGNSGTTAGTQFLGTSDNQPLEMKVNGQRAFRLEYAADAGSNPRPNVLGGYQNTISTFGSLIAGGLSNSIAANSSFTAIGGGRYNDVGAGSYESAIGGGYDNTIGANAPHAAIAGGNANLIQVNAQSATIGGGGANVISSNAAYATIAGGNMNLVQTNAGSAFIAGGYQNTNAGYGAAIGGGAFNNIQTNATYSTIAGGVGNLIVSNAQYTVIGGGIYNTNSGDYATVPGGYLNYAGADKTFAAGYRAKAIHQGSFVWADSTDANFSSTANNTFIVRAAGGVGINKSNPTTDLDVGGTVKIAEFLSLARTVVTPTAGSTITPASSFIVLTPASAVTLSATTALAGGARIGDIVILQGNSDVDTVTVPNSANTKLGAARVLGNNDILMLMWNGIDWLELSYSNNVN
jgi:hypothetical protein